MIRVRKWVSFVLVLFLIALASPAFAVIITDPLPPIVVPRQVQIKPPVPVAFSAIANKYSNVDPATTFDLSGDLVGDIQISATTVTGKNGTLVQLVDPAQLNLDNVQIVPQAGYSTTAALQLNRVYVAQIAAGGYAKFMVLQASPKVTIWFHYGTQTTSELKGTGEGGHAVLTWSALPDADLGYNVYRYQILENNAYSVTLLNDFTVQGTTFTDDTAKNAYYLYVVIAIKSNGALGTSTTVAAIQVQSVQRNLVISVPNGTAKLNGAAVTVEKPPVIKNGRLMVPASLFTNAGVTVTQDEATGKVTLTRRLDTVTFTVVMTVDVPDYTWNGNTYTADVPPYKNGTTIMVPVRVVGPALGFGVSFSSADRSATLQWFE